MYPFGGVRIIPRGKPARREICVIRRAQPSFVEIRLPARLAPPRTPRVKVAIIEDIDLFREMLCRACVSVLGLRVVAETGDGLHALRLLRRCTPDLLLLDLGLPSLDGLSVGEQALALHPDLRIIVLSGNCNSYSVYCAERLGVHGFVEKSTATVESLRSAILALRSGGAFFSKRFQQVKAERLRNPRSFEKVLTVREREILALVGVPFSDEEIGARLGISPETVEKHRTNIRANLGLNPGAELIRYARENGLTPAARSDAMWNFVAGRAPSLPQG